MTNKAIITGITGQDGYFLTKLLLEKGYEVHGVIRRNSSMSVGTLALLEPKLREQVHVHYGDLTDANFLDDLLGAEKPQELYHLAAQSFVGYSFQNPSSTYDVNIGGTLNVANAVKDYSRNTRLYFAATSELFGQPKETPQNENTPFYPRSPYAISKLAGFWTVKTYREAYKLFMTNGILFNHESEVRGPEFVTRKISLHVARHKHGDTSVLELGNLDARKDWGYAKEFVEGMWKMMQLDEPDDFVLGTGEVHTVREFVTEAFRNIGKIVHWKGIGLEETGASDSGEVLVRVSPRFYRPLESDNYCADSTQARSRLHWDPQVKFTQLVKTMVRHDLTNA